MEAEREQSLQCRLVAGLIESRQYAGTETASAIGSLADALRICLAATVRWNEAAVRNEVLEERFRKAMEAAMSMQVERDLWQQRALVAEKKLEQMPMVKE